MKELIIKKIEELEEMNSTSRKFCKLLDENNKEDKKIMEDEFKMRATRIYTIIVLKDLLENIKTYYEGK